ncbi:DUF3500 domain-containing protein [Luteolibacter ambystomatis]|uniref:DUF3500 domain-containing protein n=1 Tax=Luteolibacter ambystomatis TaxID=2824561 RepID=A0A975G7B5_9BACT|nr:DUF3500 domain-containing protein [Luteolibacter ambystomatis]QUE50096.1 DUF3500 domain-containing protein [Luteolibacter ambystomatis]
MKPSSKSLIPVLCAAALVLPAFSEVAEAPAKPAPAEAKPAAGIPMAPDMARSAKAFLALLKPEQLQKATYPMDADERLNWHFIPKPRNGIPFKDLDEAQKKAALELLHAALSDKGMAKAETIMSLEAVLAGIENNPKLRDAGLYCVTVFGTPGDSKGWAWRFEGHHISVNMTLGGGKVAITPTFMGSNPGEVRVEGPKKGTRALAGEEDKARQLAAALAEAGKPVVFDPKPPSEILTAAEREVKHLEAVGVQASDMTEAQELVLQQLLGEYIDRYRPEIAAAEWKEIRDAGLEKVRFGWAGGLKPGEAFYYRIQGPTFLIETANIQNNANHMHTTWRDFKGDFGRDLLAEHYKGHEE